MTRKPFDRALSRDDARQIAERRRLLRTPRQMIARETTRPGDRPRQTQKAWRGAR